MTTYRISFSDGRCRTLRGADEPARTEEAIQACSATNTEASILEDCKVIAKVVRNAAAMDGFVAIRVTE